MIMLKKWIPLFIFGALLPLLTNAQNRSQNRSFGAANGRIYGKVIDGSTQKGVGFATVTVLKPADSTIVSGVLTEENGDFSIDNLKTDSYILQVKFIGYEPLYKNFSLAPGQSTQDLGNFALKESTAQLSAVDVTAQKAAYSMSLDKKVFDVSKSLTSVGGSAEDVLKEVPSVMVDIDGNVSLRNGSPKIFVNGKSTTLTLDQIPAETIEKIEVITNPSAKYSAEGMSGIINIVLKKNRKPGINGRLSAGADTRGGYNGGGNLNIYKNPFNVSLSYFLHHRNSPYTGTTQRENLFNNSTLAQTSDGKRYGQFQMGRVGIDYFMDNRNTLTLQGGIGGGDFNSRETLTSVYDFTDDLLDSSSIRKTRDQHNFRFVFGDLDYKHTFKKEGHEITGNLHLSKSDHGGSGNYFTSFYDHSDKLEDYHLDQENRQDGDGVRFSGQADYVNPLTETIKLEAGLKYSDRSSNSDYDVYDLIKAGNASDTVHNELLSSDYKYDEKTYAAYVQFSQEFKKFGYQLGLRAEQYSYSGAIPSEGKTFEPTNGELGLFPSAYLTYKITQGDQLQLNYSRRVNRPNFWQRIPYTDYSDPQNLRKGNPDLKPEFTNSLEFSYNKLFGQSNFLATLYYRNTNNEIIRYSEPYHGSPDTLISYSINANSNNAYGAEFTLQTQLTDWWNFTANFNLFQTKISATLNKREVTTDALSWFGKINTEAMLPADFSVQLSGNYSGPTPTPQGKNYRYGSLDLGVKKSFLKKKNATLTLTLSDIFNTDKYKSIYEVPGVFNQTRIRQRESRYLRLTFTYSFGKQNFQLFRRKANKSSQGGGSEMQQMGGGEGF